VAIFSYDGALSFGVSGDYDTTPDIDVLCQAIERGLAELVALAQPTAPPTEPVKTAANATKPAANGKRRPSRAT
jgi:hypothetical protein